MFSTALVQPDQTANQDFFRHNELELGAGSLALADDMSAVIDLTSSGVGNSQLPSVERFDAFRSTLRGWGAQSSASELIVIDRSVDGWQALVKDLSAQQSTGRELQFVLLDSDRDGIEQIGEALDQHRDLSSLHIVSHGNDGVVRLGSTILSGSTLAGYAGELAGWSEQLSAGADILFYGCNLGATADGRLLTESISELTGADVASSTDLTGASGLGGDWELEFQVGGIESQLAFTASLQESWNHTLDVNIDQAWLDANGGPNGPYYLDQANETYILQTDVTTDGTAFAIIADDVTFDLNGHTVTYDNAAPIAVVNGSFENGTGAAATGWDFTNAPNAERYDGDFFFNEIYDGDFSLKFSNTTVNQHVTSTSSVTLAANTTYSLSAMFEYGGKGDTQNPGVNGYVRLVGTSGEPSQEVAWSNTNWRGIQHLESMFTTGNRSETYQIVVGVEGESSSAKPYFVDDIKLQRTRTFGVAVSPVGWAASEFPGLNRFGRGARASVQNGNLIQGDSVATWGHGVVVHSEIGVSLSDLNVTVEGANTSTLFGIDMYTKPVSILNNTLTSNVQTITSRDNFNGAVVNGLVGMIGNNTILNGGHAGIVTGGNGSPSHIFGNSIQLQSRYTNGFAIIGTASSHIYDNEINAGTGEFTARGIGVRGGTAENPTLVYGNTVRVQQLPNNQEYEGNPIGGAYGIQLEDSNHVEVYENEVYAYGTFAQAHALRIGPFNSGVPTGISIHNNRFVSVSGASVASPLKIHGPANSDLSGVTFVDNILETNDAIVGGTVDANLTLTRTEIRVGTAVQDPKVFGVDYSNGNDIHSNLRFVDTNFLNGQSAAYFANGVITYQNNGGSPQDRMQIDLEWTTAFHVVNALGNSLPNADVVINDTNGIEVFSGVTDQNGLVSISLDEYQIVGNQRTESGEYTATAHFGGESVDRQFLVPQHQTVELAVGVHPPSADDYTLTYIGTTLFVNATPAANHFVWSASTPRSFEIDGFEFEALAGTTLINFRGLGGEDTAELIGSTGTDELILTNGRSKLSTSLMQVSTFDIETTNVEGLGGSDTAYLGGSIGADQFDLAASTSRVFAPDWELAASGFESIIASTTDSQDSVEFFDSVGDDLFFSREDSTFMSGASALVRANGFHNVLAHANQGGTDSAWLFGSAGNDALTLNGQSARLVRGSGSSFEALGFEVTRSTSQSGDDTASVAGNTGDEILGGSVSSVFFRGNGFRHVLNYYQQVSVEGNGGIDAIYLADSTGDDFFQMSDEAFQWTSGNRSLTATGFQTQVTYSTSTGSDTVHFLDTNADNTFRSSDTKSTFSSIHGYLRAGDFESISAFSSGGNDRAIIDGRSATEVVTIDSTGTKLESGTRSITAIGFSSTLTRLDASENDSVLFVGTDESETVVGDHHTLTVTTERSSHAVSGHAMANFDAGGGEDFLYVTDSNLDDEVVVRQRYSSLQNLQRTLEFLNFETQVFNSISGGNDSISLYDSIVDDTFVSNHVFSVMRNSESYHRASGFTNVSAFASDGIDQVSIYGTSDVDTITLQRDTGLYAGNGLSRSFQGFDHADVYLDLLIDLFDEDDAWFEFQLHDENA